MTRFVVISPSTDGFRASLDRQVKQAMAGLKYTVPVGLDIEGSVAAIRTLQQRIRQLGLADFLDINIPVGRMITQMQIIKRLLNQSGVSDLLEVNLDKASLSKAIGEIKAMSESIPVNFDVSSLPVMGAISGLSQDIPVSWDIPLLKPLADAAAAGVRETIPVNFDISKLPVMGPVSGLSEKVDTAAAVQSLAQLVAAASAGNDKLAILNGSLIQTGLDAVSMARSLAGGNNALAIMSGDAAQMATSIAAGRAAISGLTMSEVSAAVSTQELAARMAILDGSAMNFAAATVAMQDGGGHGGGLIGLAAALSGASAAFGAGGLMTGRWGGALTATIPILGIVIRSVVAWHAVLDLAVEGLISVGLAAVAVTPALLVMANVGQDLVTHFTAVHNVTESLGQAIGPLTGGFDKLASAMTPATIEAFGGAMNVITGKTGLFGQAVTKVVPLLDNWIARIDLWSSAQSQLGKFITAGVGYLTQFADIVGNVVSALGQLLTKDPGIARYLLDIINGAALLLKAFTALPAPIVAGVLALHGIYVWGSVLAPLLLRLAGYVIGLAADFLLLAANPFTWIALAVAGLAALAYQSTQATSGAKAFITAIDQRVAMDNASTAILDVAASIGQLTTQIQGTSGPVNAMKQWNAQSESLSGGFQRLSYNMTATGIAFGKAFGDIPQMLSSWPALGRAASDFGHAIADIFSSSSGASIAASNNIRAYDAEITKLIDQQGTLFRVAGTLVTQGYSLAQAFSLEDLASVKASDSFAVATQKVKNLILGYQDMSVQGGILLNTVNAITFASLQQQSGIANLNTGWTTFITTVDGGLGTFVTFQQQVNTISSDLSGIAPAAIKGATSLGGLSAASLQASGAFVQGVDNGNKLINALTLQASASGLASKGTDMLTAATKDTVAQLIPLAGHSVAAQSALIALAQQGGAPAGISFQQLGKWVETASGTMGKASSSGGPAAQLNSIMGTLAKSSDNLTTDVKNLSIALGTNLTQAESAAILLARGGVTPFNNFAKAVSDTGADSLATRTAATKLGDELLALSGNNVPAARAQFESFAIGGLGLSKQNADNLWNDILQHGLPALNAAGSAATNLKDNHLAPLGVGVDTVAGKVRNLSNYLLGVPKNIVSNVHVNFVGSGSGSIAFKESIPGVTTGPSSQGLLGFHAAGGQITGGTPGRDSVLGMLMPGEVVVPTDMVKAGAVDHLRGKLPGFANGGTVSSTGMGKYSAMMGAGQPFMENAEAQFGKAVEAAFAAAVIAKFKADMAAAMGNGGGIVKFAESFIGKIPYVWGGTSLSAAGADCCLRGDQRVHTMRGLIPIEDVKPGDDVLTWDNGRLVAHRVTWHSEPRHQMTYRMTAGDCQIVASGNHPFLRSADLQWVWLDDLSPGEVIIALDGHGFRSVVITSIEPLEEADTYDITIEGTHNFVAEGLVVHNSGFTQSVYGHFGIHAPRTSEAQGAWVRKGSPTPGGLAFYHSPPGGPDPGHVAIVADGSSVVSQGGGMGPQMMGLHGLPLLFTGTPPGGFPGGTAGGPTVGSNMSLQAIALSLLQQRGWSNQWAQFNALENREAGWSMTARNPSSGAYGLAQFINGPSEYAQYGGNVNTGVGQLTAMMNYIQQRYGDPDQAWNHESLFGWYGKGGQIPGMAAGGPAGQGAPFRGHGRVRPYASGGPVDPMAAAAKSIAATAALRQKLAYEQWQEGRDYTGLRRSFLNGPARGRTKAVMADIASLHKQQGAEQVAYKHLAGAGLTAGNLNALGTAAHAVSAAAYADRALNATAGGHKQALGLGYWASLLGGAGKSVVPAALSGLDALFAATRGSGTWTVSNGPGSEWAYGTGTAGNLVPQSMDRGGWLSPGMNLVHNGLGRPEPVGAAAAQNVDITISYDGSVHNTGLSAQQLRQLKYTVRTRGGGSVQKAFGNHEVK